MGRKHIKVLKVLPVELVEAVSSALNGRPADLWIPSKESLKRDKRDAYILRLSREGNTEAEIADHLFLSGRTVRRVLARMRRKAVGLSSREVGREGHL
jgi:DNA-binding NarL/FixJ family response regulator